MVPAEPYVDRGGEGSMMMTKEEYTAMLEHHAAMFENMLRDFKPFVPSGGLADEFDQQAWDEFRNSPFVPGIDWRDVARERREAAKVAADAAKRAHLRVVK